MCYYCWVPVCPLVNWLSEKISSRDLVMMRRRDDAVASTSNGPLEAYVLLFTAGRSGHVIGLLLLLLRFLRGYRGCLIMDGCMYSNDDIHSFHHSATKVTSILRTRRATSVPSQTIKRSPITRGKRTTRSPCSDAYIDRGSIPRLPTRDWS